MNDKEFAKIIGHTKSVVLQAVQRHLAAQFYEAIDDVVQETYIRAYRSLVAGKFKEKSSLETWLYRIAANEAKRMNKKLLREEQKLQKLSHSMDCNPPEIQYDELSLMPVIEKLPEKYKDVMKLKALGNDETQIAGKLGIPKGTVKSRLSRGKLILYKLLQEEV
ncbi:MAG: RNA polymerase sigma factor [Spirochaetes bacterium]|nr:RNA polymerase sigma factor [Spirochaetota bacterium]